MHQITLSPCSCFLSDTEFGEPIFKTGSGQWDFMAHCHFVFLHK
jgi:hypothetical protein